MSEEAAIDRIDQKILKALQRDGRITNQRLADEVALSPSACLTRVKRLEQSGVITGYRAQVDPTRLGSCVVVFAELTVAAHDQNTIRRLRDLVHDIPQAIEAYQVSGDYDFLVRFLVADMQEWAALASQLTDSDIKITTVKTIVSLRVLKGWAGIPIAPAAPVFLPED